VAAGDGGKDFVEKDILMFKYNLGRKRSRYDDLKKWVLLHLLMLSYIKSPLLRYGGCNRRKQASRIMSYIHGDIDTLELKEAKAWTGIGVLMVVFGLLAASFGAIIGDLTGAEANLADKKMW